MTTRKELVEALRRCIFQRTWGLVIGCGLQALYRKQPVTAS